MYPCTKTEPLDNRPMWNMGGLRDDTGSHNPASIFGKGYDLNMTTNGAKTL